MSTTPSQPEQPQKESLAHLINVLADNVDPLLNVLKTTMENSQKTQEREISFQKYMSGVAIGLVIVIVGVAAFLTYHGKIDGSTFTFLLGLIVGYVLTFVRDQITGPGE